MSDKLHHHPVRFQVQLVQRRRRPGCPAADACRVRFDSVHSRAGRCGRACMRLVGTPGCPVGMSTQLFAPGNSDLAVVDGAGCPTATLAPMGRAKAAGVLVFAFLVVACGSGGDDSSTAATVDTISTTTVTPSVTSTTAAASPSTSVTSAKRLPGVDERDASGDTADNAVFEPEVLALFDTLQDPATCAPTLAETPTELAATEVTIVVTSIVDGCFVTTTETIAAGSIEARVAVLESSDGVVGVDAATTATELQAGGDPDSVDQWFLDDANAGMQVATLDTFERRQSSPVKVAVIDPGAVGDHKDFTDRPVIHAPWESVVDDHATHVAGIIAATAYNGIEGRGVARDIQLLDAPVVGASLQQAISWAVDNGAQVINMSLCERDLANTDNICMDTPNTATAAIIEHARRRGVLIFASVGNCGNVRRDTKPWAQCDGVADKRMWPAAYPGVLGVGAYERDGQRAWFSSANADIDVSAPGGDILSTTMSGSERWRGGTSQASPMVAAAAAVVIGHRPDISPNRILSGLYAYARDTGRQGWDTFYGSGRVDAVAVVNRFNTTDPYIPPSAPTTAPPPAVSPTVLRGDGLGDFAFGDDADAAAEQLISLFGAPSDDSGWYDTGYDPNSEDDQCMSPFMRTLVWPSLTLWFAAYDPVAQQISDPRTFVAYSHYRNEPGGAVIDLVTDRGIRLGSTLDDAVAAYPNAIVDSGFVYERDVFDGSFDADGRLHRMFAGVDLCQA